MKNIFLSIITIIFFLSCTEKMVVIPDWIPPISDRVVLLEEITGVSCPNCPTGSAKVEDLLHLYEGQLVAIAIHGDLLTEPLSDSKYDFRSEEGSEYESQLLPAWGKPAAAINRIFADGQQSFSIPDAWAGYIEDELTKEHTLDLTLTTEYDQDSRLLKVNIGVIPLKDLEGNFNISIAITESHIIDAQLNSNEVIPDYEHNHVFRKMITEIEGDFLISGMEANDVINKVYEYTLPVEDGLWVAENCHVVAFVHHITDSSKEVLQAAEAHVIE